MNPEEIGLLHLVEFRGNSSVGDTPKSFTAKKKEKEKEIKI